MPCPCQRRRVGCSPCVVAARFGFLMRERFQRALVPVFGLRRPGRATAPVVVAGFLAAFLASFVAVEFASGQNLSPVLLLNTNAAVDSWRDREPSMANDGKGHWVVVWETLGDPAKQAPGVTQRLAFTRSSDGAVTWTPPAPLTTWGREARGADSSPVVAGDADGNWVVAWQSLGTMAGSDADILFTHSANAGESWSPPRPMAAGAGSDSAQDFRPALLVLADGTWLAAWETNADIGGAGKDFDIVISRSSDGGRHWSEPLPLDPEAGKDADGDRRVVLAADAEGVVIAAWEAFAAKGGSLGVDWDILHSRSLDGGRSWSASAPLSRQAGADGAAVDDGVALAAGDGWIALWSSAAGQQSGAPVRRVWKVFSGDGGATWSDPQPLVAAPAAGRRRGAAAAVASAGVEFSPSLAALSGGGFLAAWQSKPREGGGADPVLCVFAEAGASCPAVTRAAGYADRDGPSLEAAPRVVANGAGAALVWSGDYDWRADAPRDADLRFVTVER